MKNKIPSIAAATLLLTLSQLSLASPTDPPPGDTPTVVPASDIQVKEAAQPDATSDPALEEEPVPAGEAVIRDGDAEALTEAADGNPAAGEPAAGEPAAGEPASGEQVEKALAAGDSEGVPGDDDTSKAESKAEPASLETVADGAGATAPQDDDAVAAAETETSEEVVADPAAGELPQDAAREDVAEAATTADSATPTQAEEQPPAKPALTLDDLAEMFKEQQRELARQSALLESQTLRISTLTEELDALKKAPAILSNNDEVVLSAADLDASDPTRALPMEPAPEEVATLDGKTEEEREKDERLREAGESVAKAQSDDPTRALLSSFKGAWRLPGTDAALAIGGHVKSSVVYNNDPLELKDRFIVGSIPVGDDGEASLEAQTSLTASQSRLNFDLREATDFGVLRAFVEGDFAGEGDTFRLRHAFGQWRKVLAGKTWSAFMDTEASPEEVDFEGLNGRVNVRQSQFRVMPQFGEEYEFQFSMEDPNPQIQGASGISRNPDLIASGRFSPAERLHVKLSFIAREIRAQLSGTGSSIEKDYGFGTSVSGRFRTPRWDERDQIMFQLNAGRGIGRYINDLSSIGSYDGIVNEDNGKLELLDVYSGYISYQHWWGRQNFRSNFTFGMVHIDNPNFVDDDAYKHTQRLSGNLMWSPTPRIDLGVEFLWGRRENVNGDNEAATQTQAAIRYRF